MIARTPRPPRTRPSPFAFAALIGAGLLVACSTTSGEIRELESEDAEDRQGALAALAERLEVGVSDKEREKIIAALHRSLEDRSAVVRMIAIDVLGRSGDGPSAPKIAPHLDDARSWGVRHAAIVSLRKLDARDQGARMARILREDPKEVCRLEAAKTVGAFRTEAGVEACIVALSERESDPGVQHAAWEALKAISGQDLPARPEVWRKWWAHTQAERTASPTPSAPSTAPKMPESP